MKNTDQYFMIIHKQTKTAKAGWAVFITDTLGETISLKAYATKKAAMDAAMVFVHNEQEKNYLDCWKYCVEVSPLSKEDFERISK